MSETAARPLLRQQAGSTPADTRRAVVAVVMAYLLVLIHLPLAPLFAYVLHPHVRPHCTGAVCHCEPGCRCAHHGDADHAGHASLQTCGDAAPAVLVPLTLDKALRSVRTLPVPRALPPLRFAGESGNAPCFAVQDIFHPPRLAHA